MLWSDLCGASVPCSEDVAVCSTGAVSALGWYFFCDSAMPPGAVPNGGGLLCFDTVENCLLAPNGCSTSNGFPCAANAAICSTGLAGGTGRTVMCSQDVPSGAIANGAGQWCYDTLDHCAGGTNSCNASVPCSLSVADCATGQAANSLHYYFCKSDIPPSALPNGAGGAHRTRCVVATAG